MLFAPLLSGMVLGAASLPHCAVMCGPLTSAVCANRPGKTMQASLGWLMARTAGYVALGAAVASIGRSVIGDLPMRSAEATLAVVMGLYLLWTALRLLRRAREPVVALGLRKSNPRPVNVAPWVVGVGTSLLPCGALWGAYLVASVSGSALTGALTMLGFSIASAPALLAATGLSGWLRSLQRPVASKLLSSAALAGALIMMWRAYTALEQSGGSCCAG